MKMSLLHVSEIVLAVLLAIAAAIGVDIFLKAPKANIIFEFRYEHHGEDVPSAVAAAKR